MLSLCEVDVCFLFALAVNLSLPFVYLWYSQTQGTGADTRGGGFEDQGPP